MNNIMEENLKNMYDAYSKILEEKDQKIADLEAKLAESEKDKLMWQEMYKNADRQNKEICETDIYPLQEENEQLKQQLSEKNEIIDWQNGIVEGVKQEEELLAQKLKSLGVDCIEDLGKEHNQEKISFAVEKLEKVRHILLGHYNRTIYKCVKEVCRDIDKQIDNQIKQLKKEMK